ncbi:MAG: hypothetical protein N838_15810 [Thiohalocapsa sp. PB-PSB1]|jgi:hypothetical protein|nr:MAG: hypothetical protein N838_15810 [Thiohalocapsa sp. PB-PSB1]
MNEYDALPSYYGRSPSCCNNHMAYGEVPPESRQQFLQQQAQYQLQLQSQVIGADAHNSRFHRVIEAQVLAGCGRSGYES